LYFLEFPLK